MIINKLSQISKLAQDKNLFIRWSRGLKLDKKQGHSIDHSNGQAHAGLSAQNVRVDDMQLLARMLQEYQFLCRKDSKISCWIFAGVRNGTDTDGAPTIDADTITEIGKVSDELIAKCSSFADAYHSMVTKYAYNAHRPETLSRNAEIKSALEKTWEAVNG